MPRRELLTSTERLELLAFPEDQAELIRLATLTSDDIAFVRQHRGGHNRLGIAVLMVYLRYPGQVLSADERPHGALVNLIAEQIGVPVDSWEKYAAREETRREHVLELLARLGMKQFGAAHYRTVSTWLGSTALQTTRGIVLAQAVVDELRKRLIVLPPVASECAPKPRHEPSARYSLC